MTAIEEFRMGAAIGWRCWRVLEYQRIDRDPELRLCAAGTRGVPKVWEPRQPVEAVCSDFDSTHEAPWPDCGCGLYAYAERQDAERKFDDLSRHNRGGAVGWAFGSVVMWGRVVECAKGWRSQFAYPQNLKVISGNSHHAAALADLYGVSVEYERAHPIAPRSIPERPTPSLAASPYAFSEGDLLVLLGRHGPISARDLVPLLGLGTPPRASEVGRRLGNLATANKVIRWDAPGRPKLWVLPRSRKQPPAPYTRYEDPHAALDESTLHGLRATIDASGTLQARAREVAATIGLEHDHGTHVSVAHSLARWVRRGYVRSSNRDNAGHAQSALYFSLTAKGKRATSRPKPA